MNELTAMNCCVEGLVGQALAGALLISYPLGRPIHHGNINGNPPTPAIPVMDGSLWGPLQERQVQMVPRLIPDTNPNLKCLSSGVPSWGFLAQYFRIICADRVSAAHAAHCVTPRAVVAERTEHVTRAWMN